MTLERVPASEPVKLVIVVEGGAVQNVFSLGVPLHVLLIDYDTDGAHDASLTRVPGGAGGDQLANVETLLVERPSGALTDFALSQLAGEDAERPAPGSDPWHVGELPGDGGLIVRDENGLAVMHCATAAAAIETVEIHNTGENN